MFLGAFKNHHNPDKKTGRFSILENTSNVPTKVYNLNVFPG